MYSVRVQGRGRRSRLLASAAVATMLLLTGCQGDPEPDAGGTTTVQGTPSESPAAVATTKPPTPEPSPASSAGPAANIPVPEKPALADENSKEGLEAFTEYWFELFSYGYETNDWTEFEAVTDPGCGTCGNVLIAVEEVYDASGWIVGADSSLIDFTTDFQINTQGSIRSFVEVVQGQIQTYSSDGMLEGDDPEKESRTSVTFAIHGKDGWRMLDFGSPEGS